jgi:zinc/manganese transport system substrate-binding protein
MILNRGAIGAVLVLATAITAGCGDADTAIPSAGEGADSAAPAVLATTSIWADITSNVLCGAAVPALVPAGADPHTFEPSLRDRESIGNAEVVIANGAGLEGGLADLLDTATRVVEVAQGIEIVDDDPHVWQDPQRVAEAVALIDEALAGIGGEHCADDYALQLDQLDRDVTQLMEAIPDADRVMVTSHDSLGYFADRYGLDVVGTVIPSTNTLAQTNAADLAALADLIEERGVRAIFTEQLESTADADALAERLGVRIVPLVTDALTDDPTTDTYLEMMRSNAEAIAEALTP